MSQQAAYPAKRANACTYCRERKVRCSGESRCKNCVDHGKECIYPPSQRKRARKANDDEASRLRQRLMQVEALLQNSNKASEMCAPFLSPASNQNFQQQAATDYQRTDGPAFEVNSQPQNPSPSINAASGIWEKSPTSLIDRFGENAETLRASEPRRILCSPPLTVTGVAGGLLAEPYTSDAISPSRGSNQGTVDNEESIVSPEHINWEHHGPGSWLSICSSPGVKWVCERTGASSFAESAKGLSMGWTKRLKLQPSMNRSRAPEPDLATAWKYSKAYFEESHYAVFGVVNQSTFRSRLQLQHSQGASFEDDVSWYALRSTVFAAGCIISMSKDPSITFQEAQAQAWRYFENAMSVYTELQFTPTGLVAVEALALMTFYVEGLGSPALEYMLCSSAARLAQSKGLHRQPAKIWNLSKADILHRNWLFWAIYCCEKAIINRAGRPSAIDDNDISCEIPNEIPPDSAIDIEIFTSIIKHAQIASQISRRLSSVSAFRQSTPEILKTIRSLDQKLHEWKHQLPQSLQIDNPTIPLQSNGSRNIVSVYQVHFAYYGSLMAIHMAMLYPWIAAIFNTDQVQAFQDQMSVSTETMSQAARSTILITRHLNINVASPAWLAFYYPMLGTINLFVSILKSPASITAQSDVALMDIAAGHFAHMEFITSSELAFPFTREAADLARRTVKRARKRNTVEVNNEVVRDDQVWTNPGVENWDNLDAMGAVDLDMEGWSIFSAMLVQDSLDDGNDISYPQGNEGA